MKVLWFANTPCGASEKIDPDFVRGGWLVSLEQKLKEHKDIELAVAFYNKKKVDPFHHKGVYYYPILRKDNSTFKRFFFRVIKKVQVSNNLLLFKKIVQNFNPDIVHVHGTENDFGIVIGEIDTPSVISIQGNLTVITKFFFRGLSRLNAFLSSGLKDFLFAKSPINGFKLMRKKVKYEKEILLNCRNIIGRTEWDRAITRILAPKSDYYIGEELLRQVFFDIKWNQKSFEKHSIFTTCGGQWFKGIETIFKTAILLKQIDYPFTWNIAGLHQKASIVKRCEKLYNVRSKELNINFLGMRNEGQLVDDLINSGLFVQTSHIENSPNSLCEAMLVGMPIITSCAGGTISLLENGKEGMVVQDGDEYAFAGNIVHLFNNKDVALTYAKNAKSKAETRHNPKAIVENLVSTYKAIIEKH